ncbi:hypothetical protein EJB05_44978, partial [Eragrostis curvula]
RKLCIALSVLPPCTRSQEQTVFQLLNSTYYLFLVATSCPFQNLTPRAFCSGGAGQDLVRGRGESMRACALAAKRFAIDLSQLVLDCGEEIDQGRKEGASSAILPGGEG